MRDIQMVDLKSQYQFIQKEVAEGMAEVFENTAFINGPMVKAFQSDLEAYLSVKHVIPCANGTDALQIALMGLKLLPGDEVITADFTFAATVEVISLLKLKPVLVDVDPKTFNIDPAAIEKAITPKTKAIIPVHLFGQCAAMDAISDIAKKHNLFIVEDAACTIGAVYKGVKVGNHADITVFSLHPRKFITTGEGGLITTNNKKWADWINSYKHFGMDMTGANREGIHFNIIGTNYKLTNIQAAVGLGQLENIDELLDDILEILEISDASKIKEQYRTVENLMQEERDEISSLKEKRMFAKKKKDDSFSNLVPDASKLLPDSSLKESIQSLTATTKSDYDQIIQNKNENIVAYQEELALLRENLSNELEKKDINISPEQLEVWLSSVVGDDIISMNVIFQNVKQVTQQLQELTQEKNENLEFARKYYGMVVKLNRIIVKMQEKFISKVETKIVPQLKEYESDALSNIKEANKLLVKNKNNQTLKANVNANEFTVKVLKFYER